MIKGGLNPLPEDKRDIPLGRIVEYPALEELPEKFSLGETIIRDQDAEGNPDFCTAYGTVGMSFLIDGVEGSPEYIFAASKDISGDPEEFGQDMRTIFKAWVKKGSPRRDDVIVPFDPQRRRYLKNYGEVDPSELRKQTYVTAEGPYDAFDNIRAAIWKFRKERRAVGIGVVFDWPLSTKYLTGTPDGGYGHFMFVKGWEPHDEQYLLCVNSYGMGAGLNGIHYLSRETINHFVEKYGAYMLVDIPLEEARSLVPKQNWFTRWFGWWLGEILA